jgi:hypothetical protein
MKSALSAAGEGFAIGISAMAFSFIVAGFLNVMLEPPQHNISARQELQGLLCPETYSDALNQLTEQYR